MRDFAVTRGVAHVHGVMEIEMAGHRGEIVGVVVHVVTVAGAHVAFDARASMARSVNSGRVDRRAPRQELSDGSPGPRR